MTSTYSAKQFFLDDYPRTLFPLNTNKILVDKGESRILEYIKECKSGKKSFLPQTRVYAAKDTVHLRRTVKLDPVAEYFIYQIIYINRNKFKKPANPNRSHSGYRFVKGLPSQPSIDYSSFKFDVWANSITTAHFVGFDISSYFNCLYHHDLEAWFAALGATDEDVQVFSKFLRETNAGRSVDCLPHGLYPTKMIGNDFLRFIEESVQVKSSRICRFMDDVYIFDDQKEVVIQDFGTIQRILGLKGLNINSAKTTNVTPKTEETEENISDIKKRLLIRRKQIISRSFYDDTEVTSDEISMLELSDEEIAYINNLLQSGDLEEDDAELILTIMRTHASDVMTRIPQIISDFPHLAKNVYRFCSNIDDKNFISKTITDALNENTFNEYQLFWFGMMLEEYLMETPYSGEIIEKLLSHKNATDISIAKVLENPDLRFGLPEIRQTHLSSGRSDWLSWASAVGSRNIKAAARNYQLGYFMKSSPMNHLIGEIVKTL